MLSNTGVNNLLMQIVNKQVEWIKTTKMYGNTLLWLDKNKTI
jgi:hypothetical protein